MGPHTANRIIANESTESLVFPRSNGSFRDLVGSTIECWSDGRCTYRGTSGLGGCCWPTSVRWWGFRRRTSCGSLFLRCSRHCWCNVARRRFWSRLGGRRFVLATLCKDAIWYLETLGPLRRRCLVEWGGAFQVPIKSFGATHRSYQLL